MSEIMNELSEYLPNLVEHKKLLINLTVTIILSFFVFYSTSYLLISYAELTKTEEKMATMESYVKEYRQKNDKIKNFSYHPVEEKSVDDIQTKIIFSIQSLQLHLNNLKELSSKKELHGKVFEMEMIGPYKTTIDCLQNFGTKDALVSFRKLNLQMKDGMIHTKLVYKIYTK